MAPILWIVSPCYKDAETINYSAPIMVEKLKDLSDEGLIDKKSRILFVDDGSPDNTWQEIKNMCEEYETVNGIRIKDNSGEEAAYLKGISVAVEYADVIITMDCDLQDDINLIKTMLQKYELGYDIVFGYRSNRNSDTKIYRFLASGFYKTMNLFGSKSVPQASQFRLMTTKSAKDLTKMSVVHPFLPAMVPTLNYNMTKLPYERKERVAGTSGYSYHKLSKLAFVAITEYTNILKVTDKTINFMGTLLGVGISVKCAKKCKQDCTAGMGTTSLFVFGVSAFTMIKISIVTLREYIKKQDYFKMPVSNEEYIL